MTAIDKFKDVTAFLKLAGIGDAPKEAELIITEALKISKTELYSRSLSISKGISELIDNYVLRRVQGEPLQYIIGHVDFYGIKISVGKGVLIPRPVTELLVQETIKILMIYSLRYKDKEIAEYKIQDSKFKILDLCTGSGCIAIAIAKHFPNSNVYGVDISERAIKYAIKNAKDNNITNVHFIEGDLFKTLDSHDFDCIVSNPPYIKSSEIVNLQREIRDYEPLEALDGGEDGLKFYRRIFKESPRFLKRDGLLIIELGINQAIDISKLATSSGFRNVRFIRDYSGIERIFIGNYR